MKLFLLIAAASTSELLPTTQAFTIPRVAVRLRTSLPFVDGVEIQTEEQKQQQKKVHFRESGSISVPCGHSDGDEEHYHVNDAMGKGIEDDMIAEAFDVMGDMIESAEVAEDSAVSSGSKLKSGYIKANGRKEKQRRRRVTPILFDAAKSVAASVAQAKKAKDDEALSKLLKRIVRSEKSSSEASVATAELQNAQSTAATASTSILAAPASQYASGGTIKHAPDASMTGVEERYTRFCAAVAGQMYGAKSADDFDVHSDMFEAGSEPEVIWFDDHGDLAETTPTMAAVVSGDKMIVSWRGSTTTMDWVMDAAFAPVTSSRWHHMAPSVRVQGGYAALIESDMALYESRLLDEIEQRGIRELIFTGHSLAGGVANVAHMMVSGERRKATSEWSRSATLRELSIRSIAFSPPMTSMLLDRSDEASRRFLQETVGSKTCNVIYKSDPVPHGYADVSFMASMLRSSLEEATDDMSWMALRGANVASLIMTGRRVHGNVNALLCDELAKRADLIRVMARFQHQGTIVHYSGADAEPKVHVDKGSYFDKPLGHEVALFRDIKYVRPVESYSKDVSVLDVAGEHHNFLVTGPGLGYNIRKK